MPDAILNPSISPAAPAWRLDWLTPARCRMILALVLAGGFLSHVIYLNVNCPIGLAPDEAQYWDWSRNLDWSYYSKGPAVAYIIRASCTIFDDTMPAVRYPALVFGLLTSIVTYLLTRKLFGSERLALGAVLLFHIVPMFIAGSMLMTIDPPMFFCWGLATYFAVLALFDQKRWAWPLVGIAIGLGFLAKYSEMLWFVGLFIYVIRSRDRRFAGPVMALLIACLFTIPVIVWNHQHDWASLRHVATQTGANDRGSLALGNVAAMIPEQLGAIGPTIALLMVAALLSIRRTVDPVRSKLAFVGWIGGAFFLLNFLTSFRAKVQANWPAPAYFTLVILTAWFLGDRLQSLATWKPWRGWFWGSAAIGIIVMVIVHDSTLLYPLAKPFAGKSDDRMETIDPLARLKGWHELGQFAGEQMKILGPDSFVMCDDYQQTAAMAFYVPGQPITYCAGSYFGKRFSQYDMWPNRSLDPRTTTLLGRNCLYVGKGGGLPDEVRAAFERVERLPMLEIKVNGLKIRRFTTWRCFGFKGMTHPAAAMEY